MKNKVHIYIWQRELLTRSRTMSTIKFGAELTWPMVRDGEWYEGHWIYTPLFDTREEAERHARKLAKVIEAAGIGF